MYPHVLYELVDTVTTCRFCWLTTVDSALTANLVACWDNGSGSQVTSQWLSELANLLTVS